MICKYYKINSLLQSDKLKTTPLLVFANKQDLNGLTAEEIIDSLNLIHIIDCNWSIFACSAIKDVDI